MLDKKNTITWYLCFKGPLRGSCYIEKQKMFILRSFISFLLILAQSEIQDQRKQARPHPWRPQRDSLLEGIRESRNGRNLKKLAKNLCLPRYNEGIGFGGVFKGYLQ